MGEFLVQAWNDIRSSNPHESPIVTAVYTVGGLVGGIVMSSLFIACIAYTELRIARHEHRR